MEVVKSVSVNGSHNGSSVAPEAETALELAQPALPVENRRAMRGLMREMLLKLAYRLARDPRVPTADKMVLAATIVYVISPLDLIADFIPFLGQVDDVYLLAVSLLRLLNRTDGSVLNEHWDGRGDIHTVLNRIINLATFFLPGRVRQVLVGKTQ